MRYHGRAIPQGRAVGRDRRAVDFQGGGGDEVLYHVLLAGRAWGVQPGPVRVVQDLRTVDAVKFNFGTR